MYFIRSKPPSGNYPSYPVLVEMTAREAAPLRVDATGIRHKLVDDRKYCYRRVDASYARQWVRDGYQHETTLWVDNGRVRKA